MLVVGNSVGRLTRLGLRPFNSKYPVHHNPLLANSKWLNARLGLMTLFMTSRPAARAGLSPATHPIAYRTRRWGASHRMELASGDRDAWDTQWAVVLLTEFSTL